MSKKCNDRLGETFETDEGYIITIVEYNNANDVVVEFNDKYKTRIRTRYDVCRKGNLRNPYNISIHNVGYIGLNKDGSKPLTSIRNQMTREYGLWYRMMSRCYSEYELKRRPTYKDDFVNCILKYQGHLICSTACLGSEYSELVLKYCEEETVFNTIVY